MMEEWRRKRIEEVYAKWEKRGRGSSSAPFSSHSRPSAVRGRLPRYPNGSVGGRSTRHGRQSFGRSSFVPSLGIDANALHTATVNKFTSISRCCQHCLPSSRTKFYADDGPGSGLQDILLIDRRQYGGILGRWFPYLTHVICTSLDYNMKDLRADTLNSAGIVDAIEACAQAKAESDDSTFEEALKEQQERARSIVYSMSSGVSKPVLRFVAWILFHVFKQLFNQISLQKKHVHMLREAQKRGVPIVFLPSHKSHLDYIILTFVLFNLGVHIPRIAAGDNLQLPFVSWMVCHLGGFFIKRKLDSAAGKDILYRKCLHEYMERCLLANENMEFFLEGSRSRSGKLNSPKAGLLSVLMDTVREGIVEDILVVPVNISYDNLLEKNFVRHELMGGNKKPETFRDPIRGAWYMLTTNIGSVSIDFAQPFSLQEYLHSAHVSNSSLLEMSGLSRSRSVMNLVEHGHRRLVTAASHHIIYDITQCTSLMSTWMVAFLLLFKHREGVSVSELIESYKWLEDKAASNGRAVSFTGETPEAVHYALHHLGGLVIVTNPHSSSLDKGMEPKNGLVQSDMVVSPQLELPDVFALLHLANQVSSLLMIEGVIAASILSAISEDLQSGGSNCKLEVDKEEVLEDAQVLCKLLAREFIFAPPCVDLWSVLNDVLESFIVSELLSVPSERVGGGRVLRTPQEMDNDDTVEYTSGVTLNVNHSADSIRHLTFLSRIVAVLAESYWMTCVTLCQLSDGEEVQEREFLKQLRDKMVEKTQRGVLNYVESCSMDTLRNCLKSLTDMDMVAYSNGNFQVNNFEKLIELADYLVAFKY
ncbi:glycerol-3-phosphate acyltransferase 1, mitochondrial-like [Halichondria panicea]|uniref:glycerol-3-phosphate acyltransferase 1, mitochondrial-like n=1 Tax=Halichondria panicea TaxID=6063 RepID=UPI00312B6DD9